MEVIGGRYELQNQIGQGCWSIVVKAVDVRSKASLAVKLEAEIAPDQSLLLREGKILKLLQGLQGIPELFDKGTSPTHNFLVMELLERNFEELYQSKKFPPIDVMQKAEQLIGIFENIHKKRIVHQDVKPKNMMVKGAQTYLIDFGLASTMKQERRNAPRSRGMLGTPSFASLSALLGMTQYAKDDLEALGYSIIWLIRGSLPWEAYVADANLSGLKTMKFHATVRQICQDCPDEMMHYFNYIKGLKDYDSPDYEFLRGLLVCSQRKISFNRISTSPRSPRIEKHQQPRQRFKSEDISSSTPLDFTMGNSPGLPPPNFDKGRKKSNPDSREKRLVSPKPELIFDKPFGHLSICSIGEFKALNAQHYSSLGDFNKLEDSPVLRQDSPDFAKASPSASEDSPTIQNPVSPASSIGKLEEARRTSKRLQTILEIKDIVMAENCDSLSTKREDYNLSLSPEKMKTIKREDLLMTEPAEELPYLSTENKMRLKEVKCSLSPSKKTCIIA